MTIILANYVNWNFLQQKWINHVKTFKSKQFFYKKKFTRFMHNWYLWLFLLSCKKVSAGASKTLLEAKKWCKVYFFTYNYNYFQLHEMKTLTLEIDKIFTNILNYDNLLFWNFDSIIKVSWPKRLRKLRSLRKCIFVPLVSNILYKL